MERDRFRSFGETLHNSSVSIRSNIVKMTESNIKPFKIDIPQEEVDRLKRKLKDTRLPPKPIVPEAEDKYGPRSVP